jgi:uncharacterized protein (DUF1501 family)
MRTEMPPTTARPGTTGTDLPPSCGCSPEAGLSRRAVLRAMAAGGALGAAYAVASEGTHSRYAFAADGTTGDTIVILSLRGGFDGISAVAPVGDPYYLTARPGMAVASASAIALDRTFALHPKMAPLKKWWDSGHLAVVTDVGQADPTRSHFDAMAEMERAAPGSGLRTGWIDRLAGARGTTDALDVAQVGSSSAPSSFIGPVGESVLRSIDSFSMTGASTDKDVAGWSTALSALHAGAPPQLAGSVQTMLGAVGTVSQVRSQPWTAHAEYPRDSNGNLTSLAAALADTARLIKAGIGLSVATIDSGDWDIHEGAGVNTTWGRTPRKLEELAAAMSAFAADLGTHLANVSLVTLSEFGRRVSQNGTDGTDHGHGNMVFALGGGINGGRVHGSWTGLAPAQLVDGDLPGRTDYRDVLANVLTRRTTTTSTHIQATFPGLRTTALDVAKPR